MRKKNRAARATLTLKQFYDAVYDNVKFPNLGYKRQREHPTANSKSFILCISRAHWLSHYGI